jgi:tetratricopeptide (TPR) repeat protein
MIRTIAVATVVCVLGAGLGVYTTRSPDHGESLAGWLGISNQAAIATIAPEDWAICTTMGQGQLGAETDWAQLDPDFATGKRALAGEQWDAAIASLNLAYLRDPRNADIQNYIGYAYRRLRQLGPAMQHYQQALVLNRRHRSAHQHLGELYLALGEPAGAEQHLASLQDICLIPCVEYDDLKRTITAYKQMVAAR